MIDISFILIILAMMLIAIALGMFLQDRSLRKRYKFIPKVKVSDVDHSRDEAIAMYREHQEMMKETSGYGPHIFKKLENLEKKLDRLLQTVKK